MIDETNQTMPEVESPRAKKKATGGKRGAHVAPKRTKATNKASTSKKRTGARKTPEVGKGKQKPKDAASDVRDGSKTATIIELLKREGGATTKELIHATAWQTHSLRGFLSGTLRKKMKLDVTATKNDAGERRYAIQP